MTGDAPQPGETPRTESEPWSFPDPNTAWWRVEEERDRADALAEAAAARPRHPRRRPASNTPANALPEAYGGTEPAFAPEALDAHAAGAQDAAEGLNPAALVEAEREPGIEQVEATAAAQAVQDAAPEPEPVERDHHRRPKDRFNPPEKTAEGYAVSSADEAQADASAPDTAPPDPEPEPEVMVLPEPKERVPVPEQGISRLGQAADEAKRERLENHPFWLSEEERAAAGNAWPAPEMRQRLATSAGPADPLRGKPPARRPLSPRGPVAGLLGLVTLALVASFFSWVSAEPFWLAVGHGDRGVATISRCVGSGVTQRCQGSFAAADGGFTVEKVTLLGVDAASRNSGAIAPARMVSPDSRQAYVGGTGLMVHLRWTLGFVLVLLCGYGIAGMTGARRLETARTRRNAVLISLAGPVLLLIGFLAAAY
ncbi:hypothetical protein [Actinoplanes sp. NPDC049265]|uniref:hypothetical protein n=1 Tax=Actinoplanes sp. NPDC049265 TaxID=3363902 RepID=UPI003712F8C8